MHKRQIYRLKDKVRNKGAKGLIHSNRGKLSNRKMPDKEYRQIANLLHQKYADFHPTYASEKLDEIHNLKKDPKTIRQIMINEELWAPKKHRKVDYRCSRPRKEHYGEMEQFDGSYHHWFEDRAPSCCLLASIDDATSKVTQAQFKHNEGTFPVFGFWQEYLLTQGKHRSIYLDRLRTYYNNLLPERDEELLTQFQRAMKELTIELILEKAIFSSKEQN